MAKGFTQKEGFDYRDTYPLVIKYKLLGMLLAQANEREMEIHHMNETTSFLYGRYSKRKNISTTTLYVSKHITNPGTMTFSLL